MNSPHIVVGEGRRCLCGSYDDLVAALAGMKITRGVNCSDVLNAVQRMKLAAQNGASIQTKDALLVAMVIEPLIQDCDSPLLPSDFPD